MLKPIRDWFLSKQASQSLKSLHRVDLQRFQSQIRMWILPLAHSKSPFHETLIKRLVCYSGSTLMEKAGLVKLTRWFCMLRSKGWRQGADVTNQETRLFTISLWKAQQGDDAIKSTWRGKLKRWCPQNLETISWPGRIQGSLKCYLKANGWMTAGNNLLKRRCC